MITFKQFLHEAPMNTRSFGKVKDRMEEQGARVGFEIEIFVPEDSLFWHPPQAVDQPAPPIDAFKTANDWAQWFEMSSAQLNAIEQDYGAWLAEKQDEYADENWQDYDDNERAGRKAAARAFNPGDQAWLKWYHEAFKDAAHFIREYELEQKQDGSDAEQEYMHGWRDTASSVAKDLAPVVKGRVRVGGQGYETWKITHDDSIKDDEGTDYLSGMKGYGLEIVSPPLLLDRAFEQLAKVLTWCDRNEIKTNETTGLHINISLPDMKALDPLKLVLFMGDKHVLQKFNRLANSFTRSQQQNVIDSVQATGKPPKNADELMALAREGLKHSTKWFSVNLGHLPTYLEFRAIGGADYHKRLPEIKDTLGRWLTAIELAVDPDKERQLYLKKIAALMDTAPSDGDTLGAAFKAAKAKKQVT